MTNCKELNLKGDKENKENKEYQNSQTQKTTLKFEVNENGVLIIRKSSNSFDSDEIISFKSAFGSKNIEIPKYLINSLNNVFGTKGNDEENINFAFAFLQEINAKDPLEAMLAIQMLGTHIKSIDCLSKANSNSQTDNYEQENINRATKLSRTFIAQIDTIKKYRDKGEQKVNVENVNVSDGAQAVIGSTINTTKK